MINYTSYQQYIPADFDDNSRVWIYQSSRMLGMGEALQIEPILENFIANWKSHGASVKGYANLLFGQFIIIMADESQSTTVGGCSTDSSVRIIKQIEQNLNVDMFNRQNLSFIIKDKVEVLPLAQLNYAAENGFITSETLFFNNLVATKKEVLKSWIIPVKESWLNFRYNFISTISSSQLS